VRLLAAVIILSLGGCGGKSTPASATSVAGEVALAFFESVISDHPEVGYELLDAESRHRISLERFGELARVYSRNIGFHAEKVHVRSCDEQGETAIAHVALNGRGGHARYNDAVVLRCLDGRWFIVLAANFGQKSR
jgi:hypothetical protein